MSLRRVTLAATVGMALAGAAPLYADEPSNAELLERIKRLEKKNQDLEKALENASISDVGNIMISLYVVAPEIDR